MIGFKPRQGQAQVLAYRGGRLGVAAVPGAGKTRTLSALAAQLVASPAIGEGQEVLIVTLVNAAVDHFARQIGAFVKERGLLPRIGYRVRTLHGLCSDIVRERPALVGLGEAFTILDEREADKTLAQAAQARLKIAPDSLDRYLDPGLEPPRRERLMQDGTIAGAVVEIARDFIRTAKDRRLTPEAIARGLAAFDGELPLVELCLPIYVDYQRALTLAGAVDFQDLIRLAYEALERDPEYLARLRRRWPFILEDEAQDSSRLQEDILRLLVGQEGNWVRVGDPNQAIYETFTSARPEFLRSFLSEPGVQRVDLPQSGRSAPRIIDLANFLIAWSLEQHPNAAVRARQPLQPPYIQPVPPDDPQPNPSDDGARIVIYPERLTPAEEVDLVAESLIKWLPDHPDRTVAVLAATNQHGTRMVEALRKREIDYVERLRSTTTTRLTAGALTHLLRYLARPDHPPLLARAYEVWRRLDRDDEDAAERLKRTLAVLRSIEQPEAFTHPGPEGDWLESDAVRELIEADPTVGALLHQFRERVRRWQAAVVLPVDQLLLVLAQDLFADRPADLAVAHSMAVALRGIGQNNPGYRLADYARELEEIAANERKFLNIDAEAREFDPGQHRGKPIIMTLHAAKGLEFDRVYLLACNNYDFPSGLPGDQYTPEKWFVRGSLNLSAETLAQLDCAVDPALPYQEGEATQRAREEFVGERLRLLYVGITRARRELIITWNSGRRGDRSAALSFQALRAHIEMQEGTR